MFLDKCFFATTALLATTGIAAADVAISGDGRMGIVNDETRSQIDNTLNDTVLSSRIRIAFTASGVTDGGLEFGGAIRADNAGAGAAGTAGNVFISGSFGKLSMGDVSNAMENAVGDLQEVGYTGISAFTIGFDADGALATGDAVVESEGYGNEINHWGSADTEIALYEYSAGNTTLFASIGQMGDDNQTWSVGASAVLGAATIALGYSDVEDNHDQVGGSVNYTMNDLTLTGIYSITDVDDSEVEWVEAGIGATYVMGATTIDAFYKRTTIDDAVDADFDAMGVGFTHSLGGGAAIEGGVAQLSDDDRAFGATEDDFTRVDLGLTFSF